MAPHRPQVITRVVQQLFLFLIKGNLSATSYLIAVMCSLLFTLLSNFTFVLPVWSEKDLWGHFEIFFIIPNFPFN